MPYFNQCGVDALIVKMRPGRMAIIGDQQAPFVKMKKLLERLDQAILDAIDNPQKTQHTTAIGTLF